jgi:hypothetical protein
MFDPGPLYTYALDEPLRQHPFCPHVEDLIFDGRTSAIQHQHLHEIRPPSFLLFSKEGTMFSVTELIEEEESE